jgi:hypothetical protein
MTSINKQRAAVTTGSVVSFSKSENETWFKVVGTHGEFGLEVREEGTDYASQFIDRSYVEQVNEDDEIYPVQRMCSAA